MQYKDANRTFGRPFIFSFSYFTCVQPLSPRLQFHMNDLDWGIYFQLLPAHISAYCNTWSQFTPLASSHRSFNGSSSSYPDVIMWILNPLRTCSCTLPSPYLPLPVCCKVMCSTLFCIWSEKAEPVCLTDLVCYSNMSAGIMFVLCSNEPQKHICSQVQVSISRLKGAAPMNTAFTSIV